MFGDDSSVKRMAQDSASSSSLPSFEKLEGSRNYSTWKNQMELVLIHDDLWEYTSVTPTATDTQGIKRDQKARAKIGLMVKPHCMVHILKKEKTAKGAWDALKAAFEDKGLNNRCRLLSKLVSLKLEQFSTVREYVTKAMETAQELEDLGKKIDDELLAALILQGLTMDFQPMRLAIESSNVVLTTDYVCTKLFQMEETHTSTTSASHPMSTALQANKYKGRTTANKQKSKGLKCFICDGPHKANVCPQKPKVKNTAMQAYALGTASNLKPKEWVIDSGASTSISYDRTWFRDLRDTPNPLRVTCADGNDVYGEGEGTVVCEPFTVSNVTYIPGLCSNLLSVNAIAKKGHVVVFDESSCHIFKKDEYECKVKGKAVVTGVEEGGLYKLKCCFQDSALATTDGDQSDQQMLWHRRMGHLGMNNLKLLRDKMATGVRFPNTRNKLECISCVIGKQTKQPFKKSIATRAEEVLGLVHSDVCGPMKVPSVSNNLYFLTFIDDLTRKTFVYLLKHKSEVFDKFMEFKAFAENQTGKKIRILRSDNGNEYVNKRMDDYLKQNGIQHQLTVEYTPEQNGVAERANRTICEKARTMLQESGLPRRFWGEAVHHAVFLKNRSPTIAVKGMTPEEKWSGKKCDLSLVKTFGCKAFMHIPEQKRTKWDARSTELIYTGFCDDAKAYRLVDPITGKMFKARNVVFFENMKYNDAANTENGTEELIIFPKEQPITIDLDKPVPPPSPPEGDDGHREIEREIGSPEVQQEVEVQGNEEIEENPVETDTEDNFVDCEGEHNESERRYPLRDRKKKHFPDHFLYQVAEAECNPATVREALTGSNSKEWKAAILEELDALKRNKTWTLVKPQRAVNVVDSKWLFRIKEEVGNKSRYKARLVARGFSQRYGVDYDETFSPVVRHSSLRLLLALAVEKKLNVDQMDVKTAFLNGDLSETVYMKQPEGFEEKGKEDYLCLLKRSLYGLKQAPRAWNQKLNNELLQLGFQRSKNEPCVYTRSKDNKVIILAIYVDDMLIFWNDAKEMQRVKQDLMSKFEMKDLGKAELILGMRIMQDDTGIKLSQEKYVDKILRNFGMTDCKAASTPTATGQTLTKPGSEHIPDPRIPYQNLIGSLMYLSVCTRPDIAYAVNHLSQFNSCYTEEHWTAAKRVLRYLKGTKSQGLKYSSTGRGPVHGYADASHASCYDRRSYSGVVFLYMNAAICWESRKQKTIALSTAESEYVALSEAAREAIFLKRFIAEVTGQPEAPVKIYSDSQSAVAIAENHVHHQRTKHIDVRHHYVRESVEQGHITLEYVETARMVADALTKSLLKGKFNWCVLNMSVC